MNKFSEILARELNKRELTPTAFAKTVGVSAAAMSNYIKGRIPRADELSRIAEALSVSMEYLLTGALETKVSEPPTSVNKTTNVNYTAPSKSELDDLSLQEIAQLLSAYISNMEINGATPQRLSLCIKLCNLIADKTTPSHEIQ